MLVEEEPRIEGKFPQSGYEELLQNCFSPKCFGETAIERWWGGMIFYFTVRKGRGGAYVTMHLRCRETCIVICTGTYVSEDA